MRQFYLNKGIGHARDQLMKKRDNFFNVCTKTHDIHNTVYHAITRQIRLNERKEYEKIGFCGKNTIFIE